MNQIYATVPQGIVVTTVKNVCFIFESTISVSYYLCYIIIRNLTAIVNCSNCDPECENGSVCRGPNVCDCPAGYFGNHCQTHTCKFQNANIV